MSISYSPVVESPQAQTVAAPSRLELKQSRTQEVGRRILGLLARLALETRASRLWLVSEEQTIVALGKREDFSRKRRARRYRRTESERRTDGGEPRSRVALASLFRSCGRRRRSTFSKALNGLVAENAAP